MTQPTNDKDAMPKETLEYIAKAIANGRVTLITKERPAVENEPIGGWKMYKPADIEHITFEIDWEDS